MKGIAIEGLTLDRQVEVYNWLYDTFGHQSKETWHEEQDFDLFSIVVNDKIYNWYLLKFGL